MLSQLRLLVSCTLFEIIRESTTFLVWVRSAEKMPWLAMYTGLHSCHPLSLSLSPPPPPPPPQTALLNGMFICRMHKKRREEYSFAPQSWVLPGEYSSLCYHMRGVKRRRRSKTFIVKPHNGAMGNG